MAITAASGLADLATVNRTKSHCTVYFKSDQLYLLIANNRRHTMQTFTLEQLRTATEAGGVAAVTLQAEGGEFFVRIKTKNNTEAVLSRARSAEPRGFPNPLPAIALLRKLGIVTVTFDLAHWNPEQKPIVRRRPDRSEAMKQAHEAVEYDKWFRAQVAQGITEADDPNTQWVTHEDAKASWANKRAELAKRIEGSAA
jgi:hypothetical protein